MFLIMVDAYSKWLEIDPTNVATSRATIEKLRSTFAIHGLPTTIVSDNGSNFCSEEFEEFLAKNGIRRSGKSYTITMQWIDNYDQVT
jgi:transposase InsO family protein